MSTKLTKIKKTWFDKIRKNNQLNNKVKIIEKYCLNKEVLDVGCVGQAIDYNNSDWIHNRVKDVSSNIVGVDINKKGINILNDLGYDIYHYNNLDRNKKFDIILILDVIEHVNDPVNFLDDYAQFLNKNGRIIVSTPNSNRAKNFISILFGNDYPLNYEHTFTFCPKTFIETCGRTERLQLKNFYWLETYTLEKINWKKKIKFYIELFLVKRRSNFSPNMLFVLEIKG